MYVCMSYSAINSITSIPHWTPRSDGQYSRRDWECSLPFPSYPILRQTIIPHSFSHIILQKSVIVVSQFGACVAMYANRSLQNNICFFCCFDWQCLSLSSILTDIHRPSSHWYNRFLRFHSLFVIWLDSHQKERRPSIDSCDDYKANSHREHDNHAYGRCSIAVNSELQSWTFCV